MKPALKPLMATCALTLLVAQAFQARAVDMNFSGVLTEDAPCTISGGNPINVEFAEAHVNSVMDGSVALKNIDLDLVCPGGSNRTVGLTITGSAYADGVSLQSSNTDQGLKFYKDASGTNAWDLGTPWTWTDTGQAAAPTTAYVKQVTQLTSGLTGGAFTAAATIVSAYF